MPYFVLGLLFSLSAVAAEPIRLVTVQEAGSPASAIQAQFIADLFQRINVPYSLAHRPPRRAELEFKNHLFDGDAARSIAFAENYPAAIRVDPAFFSQPVYAITRERPIKQWSDLYHRKVAYRRGIVAVENQLRQHAQLNPADSISACIRMVKALRVDACILSASPHPNEEFTHASPTLILNQFAHFNTHLWLSPSKEGLAKKLGQAIIQMQNDGSLSRYQAQFVALSKSQTRR